MRQTTFAKTSELKKNWHLIDASNQRLGRMAVQIATILMGKHRPDYTPHIDTGDFVVVTNAEKVMMTGNKAAQRSRTFFSGYAGGWREQSYADLLSYKPEWVIEQAVKRMLPKGRLGRSMLGKLKVYQGPSHPHQAQNPLPVK
ncbi:MAG: 50S ribosomal protein L13 [Phycisphaerales bacterium]|nr:50S ribosomal protein L13 [Phycisphaerales bacterium]